MGRSGAGPLLEMAEHACLKITPGGASPAPTKAGCSLHVDGTNPRTLLGEGGAEAADYAILAQGYHGVEKGRGYGLADYRYAGGVD
jgi:hypothetical protein